MQRFFSALFLYQNNHSKNRLPYKEQAVFIFEKIRAKKYIEYRQRLPTYRQDIWFRHNYNVP